MSVPASFALHPPVSRHLFPVASRGMLPAPNNPRRTEAMHKTKVVAAAVFALLLAAACGSSSGIGNVFGGGNQAYDIRGTVDSVDTNSRSIMLTNVSGYNNSLAGSGGGYGNTVRVYYDDRTSISF